MDLKWAVRRGYGVAVVGVLVTVVMCHRNYEKLSYRLLQRQDACMRVRLETGGRHQGLCPPPLRARVFGLSMSGNLHGSHIRPWHVLYPTPTPSCDFCIPHGAQELRDRMERMEQLAANDAQEVCPKCWAL